jgi:rod shape-determining protein MreC
MKKKKKFRITNRNLLIALTVICIGLIALTATNIISIAPLKNIAATIVLPLQKGVTEAATAVSDAGRSLQSKDSLLERIDELEAENAKLKEQSIIDSENLQELNRLRDLYQTDTSYAQYEKIAATVISKNAGNWYSTFIIDRGSNDGISVDMNVIASGGLVGLVTEVGPDWAAVKSIIDDSSSVSAMTITTADTCIVNGDLRLIDSGKLEFDQMNSEENILPGEMIVTSHISDKYLPGICIGTITDITEDSNHLTKTGYILPAVDFSNIREVLVIKQLKQNPDTVEQTAEQES